jgi:peptidoglycan-associated lipoprotein
MNTHKSTITLAAALACAGLTISACASEGYVNRHVGYANTRIDQTDARALALNTTVDANNQDSHLRTDAAMKVAQGTLVNPVISNDDFVSFDTNRSGLSPAARGTLTRFADRLKGSARKVSVAIEGHGDLRGSIDGNRALGEKRALEVRRFLLEQGIPAERMSVVSWGEERPMAAGASADANSANRRVDLIVTG